MSVNIDKRVVGPGNDEFIEEAWELKERIRREEDVLKQRKGFFVDAYRRSSAHVFLAQGEREELIGFASVRRDGYVLFLAVSPDYRGEGFGKRLVADVAKQHRTVTCHARKSNDDAVEFYRHLGFKIEREIDRYYEDAGDAYYLKLRTGDGDGGITDRLSELMRR